PPRILRTGADLAHEPAAEAAYQRLVALTGAYARPKFPLKGKDLVARGMVPGPEVGRRLKRLEDAWVESGFTLGRKQLLAKIGVAGWRPR
ncbi:MAG: hypothetical protein WD017_06165, partial [Cucumibacter sp.]